MMRMLVAAYGTLKRGGDNFHLMKGTTFLGEDILHQITLYDLGPYPGALPEPSRGISIDVFEVSPQQMLLLDELEDYQADAPENGMYTRKRYPTRYGEAWVYLYNQSVSGCLKISQGGWPVQTVGKEMD